MSQETLGLYEAVVDEAALTRTVERFRSVGIRLPTFAELGDPATIPGSIIDKLADVGPDEPHPLNLFRVHWYNDEARTGRVEVPGYIELPSELTGVDARIILAIGDRFPMITAHKVLAAYSCLAPRIVAGAFDPTTHRAIWPSTGNYARGGVAISRIMDSRGVAVLPEGMSKERFDWLDEWIASPDDIIRTYGVESNVKEIYDECNRLAQDPQNVILNQFSEYSNHLGH
jgi:cysteine synthase